MPPKKLNLAIGGKKAPAAVASKAKGRAAAKSPAAGSSKAKKPRANSKAAALTGTFRHQFYGASEMGMEGERTDIQMIGGYPWRLWMCRYGGGDHQLFIECLQSEETPVWHCDFHYKFTLFDQGYGVNFYEQKDEVVTMNRWLIRSEHLERYMDKNQDEDGDFACVDVECVITVKEAKGNRFRVKPTIDIYTPNEEMYDCALAIGDKKIQVNKQFLAFHSSFFKDLFFGLPNKTQEKEVKVDGIESEDFAMLLGYLYRVEDTITLDNYDKLAKMALQFQIQDVKDSVEYFLIDHYEVAIWSAGKKMEIGEKYGMESYMELTLAAIEYEHDMEKLKKSEEYKGLKKEVKERIEKRAEEIKKEKEKK